MQALKYHPMRDGPPFDLGESRAKCIVRYIMEFGPREIKDFEVHKVLDLGCGKGTFVVACLDAGLDAYGVDIRDIYQGDRSRFRQSDARNLPFPDESFDLVHQRLFISDLMGLQGCWIIKPFVDEIYRILKPRGFVYNGGGESFYDSGENQRFMRILEDELFQKI